MPMISYAQAREDIYLWRALASRVHHDVGFWIDVGAYDPQEDSVTRIFSHHGWRGINIEPLADNFERFEQERPRDINICAAVTDKSGEVTFHEIVGHQLGTMVERFADRHEASGFPRRTIRVPAVTLAEICEKHAPSDIHFLKIDVEGHEAGVIKGADFTRFRPWILVIEATEPNDLAALTFDEWDGLVQAAGYTFARMDVPNRYYVANGRSDLLQAFSIPADDYVHVSVLRQIEQLRHERDEARNKLQDVKQLIG